MLKKFLSILFDILIIIVIGIIVYYFYVSNSDNSVTISETIKTFFPFLDSNSTSKALATNDIINVTNLTVWPYFQYRVMFILML